MAKVSQLVLIGLVLVQCLSTGVVGRKKAPKDKEYEFFYFVQQWPGSVCDAKSACCYPKTGRPASDFGIHGLWPTFNDGSYPRNCDSKLSFNVTQVGDLKGRLEEQWPTLTCPSRDGFKFWSHEWTKHGTCSKSVFSEYEYFKEALDLKNKITLLKILTGAGIEPNDEFYDLKDVMEAIKKGLGYYPKLLCNQDLEGNGQIHQVYICVDKLGKDLIECPIPPKTNCLDRVQFPKF